MTTYMSTLNTRIGWPSNQNSSLGWFRDSSKPQYRTYGLENMNGYYWYQSNVSGSSWGTSNCNGYIDVGWIAQTSTPDQCWGATRRVATMNCCQNGNPGANCNCNCINACANCLSGWNNDYPRPPMSLRDPSWNTECASPRQCSECVQCDISANCDSQTWFQPNCNCIQCNCNCNCWGYGQCSIVNCQCNCNCDCTCFPAGCLVLMADGTNKLIEEVEVGEYVWSVNGPAEVLALDTPVLGSRKMLRFTDNSIYWSEEHAFWTQADDFSEWWWSYNPAQWRKEVELGVIGGLLDNSSIRSGIGYKYAHITGIFVNKEIEELTGYSSNTQLYLPITGGAPIVVNGYLVGAGVNESGFDYTKLKWEEVIENLRNL